MAANDLNLGRAPRGSSAPKFRVIRAAITPPRRSVLYPTARPHGPGVETCGPVLIRQAGELRFNRRPPARRHAVHRSPWLPIAALMLDDIKLDTVDYVPTYDERHTEPTVLPSKFPNLLVNGANGIAVGMATSIPPPNLGRGLRRADPLIDQPNVSIDELPEITSRAGLYPHRGIPLRPQRNPPRLPHTGRGTVGRPRPSPYRGDGPGLPDRRHRNPLPAGARPRRGADRRPRQRGADSGHPRDRMKATWDEPVRLILELKRDADPEIVLNHATSFSRTGHVR